ncbi:hypothetical protein B0H13DRAFT_1892288 [Mycena leptocephala]|nr:hypothetical protein B0H13DRAFT_1892288 [Mycena leptocephala]
MHPYIAILIHQVLSLTIDYTSKRVEGDMDEWEVAGFLDRFLHRLTFASLYWDKKTRPAFAQLFTELFDTVRQVTGEQFKLAPFYPDANCRVGNSRWRSSASPRLCGLTAFRGFVGTGFADPRRQRSTDLEANRVCRPRLRSVDGPAPFNRTSRCIVSLFQGCFESALAIIFPHASSNLICSRLPNANSMAKIMREELLTGATGKPRFIFHHLGFWVRIRATAWHLVEVEKFNTWREQGNRAQGRREKSPGTSKIVIPLLQATGSLATTKGAMELEEDSGQVCGGGGSNSETEVGRPQSTPDRQASTDRRRSHINELPIQITKPVIVRLQSIKHLQSQEEVDTFCAAQIEPAIKNWYLHKLFLSKISADNWDITPNQSNYVQTAHAGRNAETAIGVGLLTGILQAKERDNIMAIKLFAIERNGGGILPAGKSENINKPPQGDPQDEPNRRDHTDEQMRGSRSVLRLPGGLWTRRFESNIRHGAETKMDLYYLSAARWTPLSSNTWKGGPNLIATCYIRQDVPLSRSSSVKTWIPSEFSGTLIQWFVFLAGIVCGCFGWIWPSLRPALKPGSRVVQNSEPEPGSHLSPTAGRALVGFSDPGLARFAVEQLESNVPGLKVSANHRCAITPFSGYRYDYTDGVKRMKDGKEEDWGTYTFGYCKYEVLYYTSEKAEAYQ